MRGVGVIEGAMTIVVDEGLWPRLDYTTKIGMIKTFECVIAGPGKALTAVDVRGHLSNRILGEWRWGKLTVK